MLYYCFFYKSGYCYSTITFFQKFIIHTFPGQAMFCYFIINVMNINNYFSFM